MLDYNPAATESLVQLMWGALLPGREGGLLNARLRYFDPDRKRAGVPEDVAALVSELSDTRTTVTLVNLNPSQPRTVIVQGGGYGEHQLLSVTSRRQDHADRRPAADRAARSRVRADARAGDEALRQRSDGPASVAAPARRAGSVALALNRRVARGVFTRIYSCMCEESNRSFASETAPQAGKTRLRLSVGERGAPPLNPSVHKTHAGARAPNAHACALGY